MSAARNSPGRCPAGGSRSGRGTPCSGRLAAVPRQQRPERDRQRGRGTAVASEVVLRSAWRRGLHRDHRRRHGLLRGNGRPLSRGGSRIRSAALGLRSESGRTGVRMRDPRRGLLRGRRRLFPRRRHRDRKATLGLPDLRGNPLLAALQRASGHCRLLRLVLVRLRTCLGRSALEVPDGGSRERQPGGGGRQDLHHGVRRPVPHH